MKSKWTVAAALLPLLLLLLLVSFTWSPRSRPSTLRSAPKMVRQLEEEARRNVEDDATVAGLKALDDKDSLAATLTGGLKRKLEDMQAGDNLMLKSIEKEASAPDRMVKTAQKEKVEGGVKKDVASIKLPDVDINDVIAVIRRDRKRQMHALAISLARVSLLRKKELHPDVLSLCLTVTSG
eukprot:767792-Hanusia_phi.AAC.1